MIFPVNEYLHQNLNTTFTNIFELITDLRNTRFTGYIVINYWQFEAIILLDSGQITQVFYNTQSNYETGIKAYELILEKTQEKDGTINVVRIDSELVYLLAGIPYSSKNAKKFVLNDESLVKVQGVLAANGYSAIISAENEEIQCNLYMYFYEGSLISLAGKVQNKFEITSISDIGKVIKLVKQNDFKADIRHIDLHDTVEVLNDFFLQATIKNWEEYYSNILQNLLELLKVDKKKYKNIEKIILEIRSALAEEYHFLDPFMDVITINGDDFSLNAFLSIYDFINGMDKLILKLNEEILLQKWKKIKEIDLKKVIQDAYFKYEDMVNSVTVEKRVLIEKFM